MEDNLDELDYQLILALQQDARRSNSDLAREFGVTHATISRRIERLRNEGIIAITAVPDPHKIGYNTVATFMLKVELDKLDQVMERLAQEPVIHFLAMATGDADVHAWATFHSHEELADFVRGRLSRISGIKESKTSIHLVLAKRTYGWLRANDRMAGTSADGQELKATPRKKGAAAATRRPPIS